MGRKRLLTLGLVGIVFVFFVTGIYAATVVPDVIQLDTKAYAKNKKGPVNFNHRKHQTDYKKKYPEFYKVSCGECHHDQNHKPRKNLKASANVKKCIACHKQPAYIEGKKAKGLSQKQKLKYHANALHENCKGCHKKINKKARKKAAPTTCKACHGK
jgi:hypothetical protein